MDLLDWVEVGAALLRCLRVRFRVNERELRASEKGTDSLPAALPSSGQAGRLLAVARPFAKAQGGRNDSVMSKARAG